MVTVLLQVAFLQSPHEPTILYKPELIHFDPILQRGVIVPFYS